MPERVDRACLEERRRLVRAGALYGGFGGITGGNNRTSGDGALVEVGVDLQKEENRVLVRLRLGCLNTNLLYDLTIIP